MATVLTRVEKDLVRWLYVYMGNNLKKVLYREPTDRELIETGLYQLKSNIENKQFEIKYDEKTKCLKFIEKKEIY